MLQAMLGLPVAAAFAEPVDPSITEYYDVIARPMDLGTAAAYLAAGGYASPQRLLRDIRQVSAPDVLYLPPGNYMMATTKAALAAGGCAASRRLLCNIRQAHVCLLTMLRQCSRFWWEMVVPAAQQLLTGFPHLMSNDSPGESIGQHGPADTYYLAPQIWENCRTFNNKGDEFWKAGEKCEAKFARLWAKAGLPTDFSAPAELPAALQPPPPPPPPRIKIKLPASGAIKLAGGGSLKVNLHLGGRGSGKVSEAETQRLATATKVGMRCIGVLAVLAQHDPPCGHFRAHVADDGYQQTAGCCITPP